MEVYHSPSGFATTNNPVEVTDKVLKRDVTKGVRLQISELVEKLGSNLVALSKVLPEVSTEAFAPKNLVARMRILKAHRYILKADHIAPPSGSMVRLLQSTTLVKELLVSMAEHAARQSSLVVN
ncbi:hypothetical protein H257_09480 [Aphanomyces astaci]|uniref:Uncharacterized protein n=1 Tax=Aphanomyces astaci TaxID=112090 RepID=W4GAZ2_APHAT|nr:hypothetical protein H257_09480 [Aphanomyces astaci]ETV76461.1 hypothetical protein H257_09480 [Aphanomyces astaci]|eukprot:XP_009834006.1 hypothetical protein H257_09480 [Aphanomyces astaci]